MMFTSLPLTVQARHFADGLHLRLLYHQLVLCVPAALHVWESVDLWIGDVHVDVFASGALVQVACHATVVLGNGSGRSAVETDAGHGTLVVEGLLGIIEVDVVATGPPVQVVVSLGGNDVCAPVVVHGGGRILACPQIEIGDGIGLVGTRLV